MPKLYIASKVVGAEAGVQSPFDHLYVVLETDEGEYFIIRGGPTAAFPNWGEIVIEDGFPETSPNPNLQSRDSFALEPSANELTRNFTLLAEGTQAQSYWDGMVDFVRSLSVYPVRSSWTK